MDFNKLTLKSQEAVAAAQELARRMGNPELYPQHLLLALLDQELPQQLVPDAAALREQAEASLRGKPSVQGIQDRSIGVPRLPSAWRPGQFIAGLAQDRRMPPAQPMRCATRR